MPAEQALDGQWFSAAQSGIEHHFYDTFDVPIYWSDRADVYAQAASDGRAHGFHVQHFALDFAGSDHVLSQSSEAGLIAQRQSHVCQTAQQHAWARLTLVSSHVSVDRS